MSLTRKKTEIRKVYHKFNKKHSKEFKIHNSPIATPGETKEKKFARLKWLERGAGFIMALDWVLHPEKELPEWVDFFGTIGVDKTAKKEDNK